MDRAPDVVAAESRRSLPAAVEAASLGEYTDDGILGDEGGWS